MSGNGEKGGEGEKGEILADGPTYTHTPIEGSTRGPRCQAIFEAWVFSQLANSDERKLRQLRARFCSSFPAVLFFLCELLNRLFGNPANWSVFPDRQDPVIWQGRASGGGH